MDATTLGQRLTVLCESWLYRGCAIPIAWKMVCTQEKGAWEPYWKALFSALQGSVPTDWTVIVLADRGMSAPWLFQHLVQLGWHPFLRRAPYHAVRHLPRSGIELGGGSRVIQPT
jgi:hypothetical protein